MSDVSVGELFVRLVLSLGVVVAVMAAAAWALKRASSGGFGARGRTAKPVRIEILGRHGLGRRSSVALVRAGERGLLLGVTDNNVTLLAEGSAEEFFIDEAPRTVSATGGEPAESTWRNITETLRERTVRRS